MCLLPLENIKKHTLTELFSEIDSAVMGIICAPADMTNVAALCLCMVLKGIGLVRSGVAAER